jgi:TolB protein
VAWSPDGSTIAYARVRSTSHSETGDEPNWNLYVVGPDGSDPHELNMPGMMGIAPAWSPDGRRLAFSSVEWQGDGSLIENIYTVNPDGSGLRQLTTDGSSRWPVWTADDQLVYNASADSYFVVDVDLGNPAPLIDLSVIQEQAGAYRPEAVAFQP